MDADLDKQHLLNQKSDDVNDTFYCGHGVGSTSQLSEVVRYQGTSQLCKDRISRLIDRHRYRVIHSCLVTVYTILFLLSILVTQKRDSCKVVSIENNGPLAGLDLQYTQSIFHNLANSVYTGDPGGDVDTHWALLLSGMDLRASATELEAANQASVALPEAGGFMVWLGAYHGLHCINMIRQWNYPEYYHVNRSTAEMTDLFMHVEHCIELLRQSTMCRPDLSLTTFKWSPNKSEPMFNASESEHHCVDWNKLTSSLEHRIVPESEYKRLQNPLRRL